MMTIRKGGSEDPGARMVSQERLLSQDPSVVDLQAPTRTQRISVDVDVASADMSPEQICGLLISALERAYPCEEFVSTNVRRSRTKG
jgi:hypothetical protein